MVGGVPQTGLDGGGYPGQVWMVGGYLGYPQPGLDGGGAPPWPGLDVGGTWGTPHPPIRQSSIASTCYVAGGMPLAFTQEDFLVIQFFRKNP